MSVPLLARENARPGNEKGRHILRQPIEKYTSKPAETSTLS
jgi:hypothetical protein